MALTFQEAAAAHLRGDLETAERAYAAHAANPRALHNLGVIYSATGRDEDAEAVFRASLAKRPGYAHTEHSLAMVLLRLGRWVEAWPLYEARRRSGNPDIAPPAVDFPEWRGEPLRGKRLMVYREQGFGDEIMFSRLLPVLQLELGAEVFSTTFAPLAPLLRGAGLVAGPDIVAADHWTLTGSLPMRLGLTPDRIPGPLAFLDSVVVGGGVGVCPSGAGRHPNDLNRSLQGADAERLLALGRDLRPEATGAVDFLETAQIVGALDLVLTVDTSIAHLAGSLGVPTIVLLPFRGVDWRWGRRGDRSPWYPAMRLLRQRQHGDWSDVLAKAERLAG